jgi:hypothetical protein
MSTTWTDLFPGLDGDPVRGRPYEYADAYRAAGDLVSATRDVAAEFERVRGSDQLGEMGGATADQLVTLVQEIDGSFGEVPGVFTEVERTLRTHHDRLRELRTEAIGALDTARARWREVESTRETERTELGILFSINSQIDALRTSCATPEDEDRLEQLEWTRTDCTHSQTAASNARRDAEDSFDGSRDEWHRLREREDELIDETARTLRDLDLGDLKDPNRLLELVSDVGSWAWETLESLAVSFHKMIVALAEGRFLDALHHLSDYLEAAITIIGVVSLAILVFASGGTLLLVLGAVALGLGAAKLAADAVLAHTQHPHPETGQPKTWGEVAVDAVTLAVSAALLGAGAAGKASLGETITGLRTLPSGSTYQTGLAQNLIRRVNPAWLYRSSTMSPAVQQLVRTRAQQEVIARTIDDIVVAQTLDRSSKAVQDQFAPPELSSDVGGWADPVLRDHIADSPATRAGLRAVDAQQQSIHRRDDLAPLSSRSGAGFQLCEVGP